MAQAIYAGRQGAGARRGRSGLTTEVIVTSDPDLVSNADRLVLPGVGAFAACLNGLLAVEGLKDAITHSAIGEGRPFLGICVGMQLLAEWGTSSSAGTVALGG